MTISGYSSSRGRQLASPPFQGPLTGIVFALEVPYKDDLARRAFLPSIISGVASYVTFASVEGSTPLFSFASTQVGFTPGDLVLAAVFGVFVGVLAVAFSTLYHQTRRRLESLELPFMSRYLIGGAAVGAIALLVRVVYDSPYTFGPGYSLIQGGSRAHSASSSWRPYSSSGCWRLPSL